MPETNGSPTPTPTPTATPTLIDKHSATEMLLGWTDGAKYAVPFVEVRFFCPCAHCVDEHTGQRTIRRESITPDVRVTGVQLVGRYAAQLTFSDGHRTGIYPFDRLREICEKVGLRLA